MPARIRVAAVYTGALLGPLGGGVISPMLPQVATSLHTSASAVATALTVYFVPFAAIQLVSGTLGERWGRRRTVQVAYLGYAVASAGCALAPGLGIFLAARAVQGAANAFTSPLLLAGLAGMVPSHRLSRSVGVYSSVQAAGQSIAPLLGGAAAAVQWRWAFAVVTVVSLLLALAPPPGERRPGAAAPSWSSLVTPRMGWLSLAALLSYLGASGLAFLVALYAQQHLGASPGLTGVALVGFGVAGLVLGSVWGTVCERFGSRRSGIVAAVATAATVAVVGLTGSVGLLTACWTAAGAAASMLTVALQNLTVRAVPGNRGGALSAVSAFRFSGGAVAPLVWLPLYGGQPVLAFAAAGASVLLVVPSLGLMRGVRGP